MPVDDTTDVEKIKELKASVAVALLEHMEKLPAKYNLGAEALEHLANAYRIVCEAAPRPAARVGTIR